MLKHLTTLALVLLAASPADAQRTTPIMGWSSWNTYHVNISDSLIRRQADAMRATGLQQAGYTYINIDDGFFGHRDTRGRMVPHARRFPHGLRGVADYIHSLGMRAGIYSDAGTRTCGSIYDKDTCGLYAGLYGHERQDARALFREWGFDFIKIDYCGAGTELGLDERERYTDIYNAFRAEGCEPEINLCRWAFPGTWAAGIAASWRIAPDIRPRWRSVRDIVERNLYLSAYCSPGHYNDMDMLEVGRGMSQTEDEAHFALWCMMSSPLLIGCDMTQLAPTTLALLTNPELIALNQDTLSLQPVVARCQPTAKGRCYVLVKDIGRRYGSTRAVALYNPTDTVARLSVSTAELCLAGRIRLRDLVARRKLPSVSDSIAATLAPHSVLMLRAEGDERIEATRYEAEWAYLPLYDALCKREKQITPTRDADASGGMLVTHVGGSPQNTVEWRDIYSKTGGDYTLTIHYKPSRHRELTVSVNGSRVATLTDVASAGAATLRVTLRPGTNTIALGNPYNWAPDIDSIEITAVE